MLTLEQVREKIQRNMPANGVAKRNTPLEWTRIGKDELQSLCNRYTIARKAQFTIEGGRPFMRYEATRGTSTCGVVMGLDFPTADAAKAACQEDALR